MCRLFRFTAISVFGLSLLITTARWIGVAQPLPLAAWFTNPDGTPCTYPCLFGIRPGVTRLADAVTLIRAHPATRHMQITQPNSSVALQVDSDQLAFFFYRDKQNRVESIFLASSFRGGRRDVPLGLGDVIATLGIPHLIPMRNPQNLPTNFAYPELGVSFSVINWDAAHIAMSHPSFSFSIGERWSEDHPDAVPWVGFGSRDRYVRVYAATHPPH
ncbi:MAG: hypothetical protein IT324_18685 [Anaerolineae bacterium]|nr:hypothetical protein [Anaerolineae bacterium]